MRQREAEMQERQAFVRFVLQESQVVPVKKKPEMQVQYAESKAAV